jgi:hypothetical protein
MSWVICVVMWETVVYVIADVVGIVTGVSPAVTIDVQGRPVSKRTLRLTDTRSVVFTAVILGRPMISIFLWFPASPGRHPL